MANEFKVEFSGNKSGGYKGALTTPDGKVWKFDADSKRAAEKTAKRLAKQWVEANRTQHIETVAKSFEL